MYRCLCLQIYAYINTPHSLYVRTHHPFCGPRVNNSSKDLNPAARIFYARGSHIYNIQSCQGLIISRSQVIGAGIPAVVSI